MHANSNLNVVESFSAGAYIPNFLPKCILSKNLMLLKEKQNLRYVFYAKDIEIIQYFNALYFGKILNLKCNLKYPSNTLKQM